MLIIFCDAPYEPWPKTQRAMALIVKAPLHILNMEHIHPDYIFITIWTRLRQAADLLMIYAYSSAVVAYTCGDIQVFFKPFLF